MIMRRGRVFYVAFLGWKVYFLGLWYRIAIYVVVFIDHTLERDIARIYDAQRD